MPHIEQLVTLRPEVVEGNLHGIISLYALLENNRNTFECDPQRVFAATFPTAALKRLLVRLGGSLSARDGDRKGNFVISGGYGAGKSHLLLALYHTLAHPDVARPWLAQHGIAFEPPDGATVVLMPMTNLTRSGTEGPVEYLWEPIFAALGYEGFRHTGSNFPTVTDLRKAVAGGRVFLIVDELERWFMPIRDRHQAEANISFLQNLNEFARDPSNGLFVLLTLLNLEPRIGNIVGRDDAFLEDLTGAPDRRQVVLHRLVQSVDRAAAEQIVDAYIDQYRPVDAHVRIGDYNSYRQEMVRCYPFHPVTIETVFARYSSVARREETSYQNSRGALYLLAHVLQETQPPGHGGTGQLQARDLLLPGDISLTVEQFVSDLNNLDPRLIDVARENAARSVEQRVPLAASILSTVLLHSLGDPRTDRGLGADFGAVLLGALRPGNGREAVTASAVQIALQQLEETALNLHFEPTPPRWLFRAEVNIVAQVNRRARPIEKEVAQPKIYAAIRNVVGGAVYVFPFDEIPDQRELTLVLTTERLESEAILDQLYRGRNCPNALIIVDPRDASIADDGDLLSLARRILAAEALRFDLVGDAEAQRRLSDMLDGTSGLRNNLRQALRDRYGYWRAPVYDAERGDLTFTRVPVSLERQVIYRAVQGRYDSARFRQNVLEAVAGRPSAPPTVADVRTEFLKQRSFAKPIHDGRPSDEPIDQAIRGLVAEAQLEIIRGGDERYVCGRDPGQLQPQWTVATPPESHRPRLRLDEAIREVVSTRPQGLTMRELREQVYQVATTQYPGETLDAARVDAQLIDFLTRREMESTEPFLAPDGSLPDDLVVRPPQGTQPPETLRGPQLVNFGPATAPQLRTDVVSKLAVSDRLSTVSLTYRCSVRGADLAAHRDLIGLSGQTVDDATLALEWKLSDAPVTDRAGLLALLNSLPHPNLCEVTIKLRRELAS